MARNVVYLLYTYYHSLLSLSSKKFPLDKSLSNPYYDID